MSNPYLKKEKSLKRPIGFISHAPSSSSSSSSSLPSFPNIQQSSSDQRKKISIAQQEPSTKSDKHACIGKRHDPIHSSSIHNLTLSTKPPLLPTSQALVKKRHPFNPYIQKKKALTQTQPSERDNKNSCNRTHPTKRNCSASFNSEVDSNLNSNLNAETSTADENRTFATLELSPSIEASRKLPPSPMNPYLRSTHPSMKNKVITSSSTTSKEVANAAAITTETAMVRGSATNLSVRCSSSPSHSLLISSSTYKESPVKTNPYLSIPRHLHPKSEKDFSHQISSTSKGTLESSQIEACTSRSPTSSSCSIVRRPESWKATTTATAAKSERKMDSTVNATAADCALYTYNKTTQVGTSSATKTATTNRPELPGEVHLPDELLYDPKVFTQPIKDEYRSLLSRNAKLGEPLLNGWTLYGHQKRAILKGLMKRRVILALDMGLGKTVIGCVWANAFQKSFQQLKIFIVCPTTLKTEWRRTAEEATGIQVEAEKKSSKDSMDATVTSWAKIPTHVNKDVQHFVAVFDEAHSMQSMESNRTQSALKFVKDKRCVGVLLLTGTPMKNGKPCNLFPLLKAVRHPLGNHQRAFERHFCEGGLRAVGGRGQRWIASGQANLKQLHRLIEPNLLYMTKDEYLKDIPPMKRETRKVPVNPRNQGMYESKIKDLAKLKEAMKTNKNLDNNALLGATQALRVICSFAKLGATVQIAKQILEVEESIVIFTNFQKCASNIAKSLQSIGHEVAVLTGETPVGKRQALVDGFQNELYSVFITTFGAGGVGITLTKARTVIFLDRPWTPGELMQAEDRIRRIGQTRQTRCISISAFDFDDQLDNMLREKSQATQAVLTKDGMAVNDSSSASINIQKLVAALVSRSHFR